MTRAFANLQIACRQVFARFSYIALAGGLAGAALGFALWFPNLALISAVLAEPDEPLAAKLGILLSLLGALGTNFSLFSATYTVAIAVLFGINTAMIVFLLKQRRTVAAGQNIVLGSGGMASGALGIGCAACGSLVASAALSFVGGAGAVAAMPLNGGEFGLLGVALLLVSLFFISRNIAQPVCALPASGDLRARVSDHKRN